MIKEFVEAWDKNKDKLERYFKKTKQEKYDTYGKLVHKLIAIVVNPYLNDNDKRIIETDDIRIIDDGDYQGTQIFIVHERVYQPDVSNYYYTHNYYGSCSGCDTLLGISEYDEGLPNEEQVQGYMTLSLHLLQKFKKFEE